MAITHPFPPIISPASTKLILGTFPSVKSRQTFYYGHPQNRFWRVIAGVFGCAVPVSVDDKITLILNNNLALWDVAGACEIEGSADASIREAAPNDIAGLLKENPNIRSIYANGKTAGALYNRLVKPFTGMDICVLPSTSPANAATGLEGLLAAYRILA